MIEVWSQKLIRLVSSAAMDGWAHCSFIYIQEVFGIVAGLIPKMPSGRHGPSPTRLVP